MDGEIVVGTVRASRNGRHVVVRRDGSTLDVAFEGTAKPLIGGDVVGLVRYGDFGEARMELRRSVLDILLEGRARIFPMGMRPDLTARVLAKILSRSKSAVLAPGSGISMERMPVSDDPELAWAMSAFQPEAERLSIALNVIDVKAVAKSPWQASALRDLTLPADIEGSRRAMNDLSRLLRSGFHPDCNRMVESHTDNREISVNFVLPYSPFSGALGFAREIAAMDRGTFPCVTLTVRESRMISAARHVALALAHARLGAGRGIQADVEKSPRAAHMAACFADAAAVLAFLSSGGRPEVVAEYADLKEASLHYGYSQGTGMLREGILEHATHGAIRAAAASALRDGADASEIVSAAARIARRCALPASRFSALPGLVTQTEAASASLAALRVGRDLRECSRADVDELSGAYRSDLRFLVEEHADDPAAAARLVTFGAVHVPLRMDAVFERETDALPGLRSEGGSTLAAVVSDRASLARRIRAGRNVAEESIEFGEPSFAP